jgi:hypothetical protein
LAKKTIRKYSIDIKDPSTVSYNTILRYIEQQTESDQSVEDLERARGALPATQGKTELVDLVGQLQPTLSVTQEQQLVEPVVKKTIGAPDTTTTAVDQLTKAFEKLSVNLVQQIQSQQSYQRPSGSYRRYRQGQQSYGNPPVEGLRVGP